jgi:hypothetical protein
MESVYSFETLVIIYKSTRCTRRPLSTFSSPCLKCFLYLSLSLFIDSQQVVSYAAYRNLMVGNFGKRSPGKPRIILGNNITAYSTVRICTGLNGLRIEPRFG